jgi:hypothetical protein
VVGECSRRRQWRRRWRWGATLPCPVPRAEAEDAAHRVTAGSSPVAPGEALEAAPCGCMVEGSACSRWLTT